MNVRTTQPGAPVGAEHMLSFDLEEYFHVEAAAGCLSRETWPNFPSRLHQPVEIILNLLAEHRATATFFVLGWVARRQPALVRRIVQAGHEIASHGMDHQMLSRLSPDQFRRDLLDSRSLLEDLSGRPVIGYRAPTFSITRQTAWALDMLAESGFRYDSSVFPVRHDRYGVPDAPARPHWAAGPAGGRILELPPLTVRLAGVNWPVGGGGYLRLLPVRLLAWSLRRAERAGWPGMIYIHPWELDPAQPPLPMGRLARIRHRVGLARTEGKLRWLLGRFRFCRVDRLLAALADRLASSPAELANLQYGPRSLAI